MSETMPGSTRTLARGLRILERLSRADREMRMAEIAREVGLNLNTTGRLLATLELEGFASRSASGHYGLGNKLIFAAARKLNVLALSSVARPYLVELRNATGETAMLVTRAGNELIVVDVVEGSHELRVVLRPGLIAPLFPAPTGWALVADESVATIMQIERALGPSRQPVSEEEAQTLLEHIRLRGYVLRHSDPSGEGTCTVATPIRSHGVIVAAAGIAGPSRRWNEASVEPQKDLLLRAAAGVSSMISGGDGTDRSARLVHTAGS